ncbi:GTPase family protein [Methylomonas methanica]|uniref:G domain-containing protein n=1 Tax=Methylomonas methanica (strain DSM 25384 / MC09) TaxID=857087 RepID=G0A6G3_METMM|nr:GTPase [Methylomonas methanica]AEG02948.1 hypothetical protein Metme_4610 [Methylomonas methanica MC09]
MSSKFPQSDWINRILTPKVSDSQLHEKLVEARLHMPVPVFWLLGKTQSGKSSVVQALTGSSRIEIGQGFRPCTRQSFVFDFPDAETAFVRFLDTRGLGEAGYDPAEDMSWCQSQAHLLMVVVKAMDHELDGVLSAVRAIRLTHPDWPLLVIQTCLHEGYPHKTTDHVLPYPYADDRFAGNCPPDLTRSLNVQRQHFKDLKARFVAVDLTQAEDGYIPIHYGLDALWSAIESALPTGLRQILLQNQAQSDQLNDVYAQHAYPHVLGYAISCGLLAMTPVPAASVPLVIAAQGKLFQSIASIYGLTLTRRSVYEVASAVGIGGLSFGIGVRELAKFVPGWGSLIAGLSTAAITYALGMTLCYYYAQTQQGHAFSPEMLKAVYDEQLQRGRELLKERFSKDVQS